MKKTIVITLMVLGLLVVGGVYRLMTYEAPVPPRVIIPSVTKEGLLELVNAERAKAGAGRLAADDRLGESAQWMADDMAEGNYFAHTSPVTGKKVGLDRAVELTGMTCSYIQENQYKWDGLWPLSSSIVDAWMSSSRGHREAMLDKKHDLTGIGIVTTSDEQTVVVQHFCTTK